MQRQRQSDGVQPHMINIQFHKKMHIHEIVIYTDFKLDESYTPKRMSVRAGNTAHDLEEVRAVEEADDGERPADDRADGSIRMRELHADRRRDSSTDPAAGETVKIVTLAIGMDVVQITARGHPFVDDDSVLRQGLVYLQHQPIRADR